MANSPIERCNEVAGILNKFNPPLYWCKPEQSYRKSRGVRVPKIPSAAEQCSLGFDPNVEYVWMPYTYSSGTILHLAYVDCDYVD